LKLIQLDTVVFSCQNSSVTSDNYCKKADITRGIRNRNNGCTNYLLIYSFE